VDDVHAGAKRVLLRGKSRRTAERQCDDEE
jgi:hypothetical protein